MVFLTLLENGALFVPGSVIRVEFPAQGYVNPLNTTLEFDVTLQAYGTQGNDIIRFQNKCVTLVDTNKLVSKPSSTEFVSCMDQLLWKI